MKLTSTAFEDQGTIPVRYTCQGEGINPPLQITDVPIETVSLVLTIHDPDSPSGNYVHWTMWDISPTTTEIAEASVPNDAVEGITSAGKPGYVGPCPGNGVHRYIFTLYALDTKLKLNSEIDLTGLQQVIDGHILTSTTLMGRYEKTAIT
jgi:hypothetical protein